MVNATHFSQSRTSPPGMRSLKESPSRPRSISEGNSSNTTLTPPSTPTPKIRKSPRLACAVGLFGGESLGGRRLPITSPTSLSHSPPKKSMTDSSVTFVSSSDKCVENSSLHSSSSTTCNWRVDSMDNVDSCVERTLEDGKEESRQREDKGNNNLCSLSSSLTTSVRYESKPTSTRTIISSNIRLKSKDNNIADSSHPSSLSPPSPSFSPSRKTTTSKKQLFLSEQPVTETETTTSSSERTAVVSPPPPLERDLSESTLPSSYQIVENDGNDDKGRRQEEKEQNIQQKSQSPSQSLSSPSQDHHDTLSTSVVTTMTSSSLNTNHVSSYNLNADDSGSDGGYSRRTSTDSSDFDDSNENSKNSSSIMDYDANKIYLPAFATERAAAGDYRYAIDLFTTWINGKFEPDDYRIYYNRAWCYYELDDFDAALKDITVVIRLNDKFTKGYYVRGKILLELKRFDSAIKSFHIALRKDMEAEQPLMEALRNAGKSTDSPDPDAPRCRRPKWPSFYTERWIRKTIYLALVDEGINPEIADYVSGKYLDIDEARDYVTGGNFKYRLYTIFERKCSMMKTLMAKEHRLFPRSWVKMSDDLMKRDLIYTSHRMTAMG